jgi:quinohemoprotein ethanol dehydrogenase
MQAVVNRDMKLSFLTAFLATNSWLAAGSCAGATSVIDVRAIADETQGANWLAYGRTYSESRFSPLASINESNVKELGLAWYLDLPGQGTLEGTPLVIDGVLYFSGTYGKTFAVDARSGRELWEFDPEIARYNPQKLRLNMGAHRGLAYWKGKIYVGTNDGRLLALDSRSGKVLWTAQTVSLTRGNPKFNSGAPRAFNGKVVIGHGSAEAGTRGYATAYDADTGRQLWRFYTVPGDSARGFKSRAEAMAATTWTGNPQNWGGGSVWDSIVYDPEFNRIYLATGNGNAMNRTVRSPAGGDNLFLCSIVALDADTGRYLWHYQVVPGDSWDYDATAQMVLANLTIAGKLRKVLMQASKDGFFYVLDRSTGKLISAEKYTKVTWAERIDLNTGRPIEVPNAHYRVSPVTIWPSDLGAHNWPPMSFDRTTGLVYIPTLQLGETFAPIKGKQETSDGAAASAGSQGRPLYSIQAGMNTSYTSDAGDGTGALLAWDPVTQTKRWEVPYDSFWNGGVVSTAGNLVFQGTGRGQLIAYRASTGEKLWSFNAGLGIIAAPITYSVDGVEYLSILIGYGGLAGSGTKLFDYGWRFGEQPRRLLTFSLGGHTLLPPGKPPRFSVATVDDPSIVLDVPLATQGAKAYDTNYCWLCHGTNLENSGSIAPDLRESHLALNWEAFRTVLNQGSLAAAGMPKFNDLSEQDMRALYTYIRQRARETAAHERAN